MTTAPLPAPTAPFQGWPKRADVSWLTPELGVGSDHSNVLAQAKVQAQDLVSQGVTHVLDCRSEDHDRDLWAHFPQASYHRLGVPDDGTFDDALPSGWYTSVLAWASDALAEGGTLFVHCHMGVNRAPTAAWLILVGVLGYDPAGAYSLLTTARPVAYGAYIPGALAHLQAMAEGSSVAEAGELVEMLDLGRGAVRHLMAGVPVQHVNDAIDRIGAVKYDDFVQGDRR